MEPTNKSYVYTKTENKEEKKTEKAITGKATIRKKNILNRLVDTFIAEDFSSVKEHVYRDVVVPRIKQTVADVCNNTINMLFFGSSAPRNNWLGSSTNTIRYSGGINYSGISTSNATVSNDIPRFDEFMLDSRADAEHVLDDLRSIIDRFDRATINDLYDLVGMAGKSTYENYGWTSLKGAEVIPIGDKYYLRMPKPILLR